MCSITANVIRRFSVIIGNARTNTKLPECTQISTKMTNSIVYAINTLECIRILMHFFSNDYIPADLKISEVIRITSEVLEHCRHPTNIHNRDREWPNEHEITRMYPKTFKTTDLIAYTAVTFEYDQILRYFFLTMISEKIRKYPNNFESTRI